MNHIPQRLNIAYRIVWDGDWHAGSGEGSAGIDRLARRRGPGRRADGVPFLPGSQLKGVLRHQCERLAALLGCPVVSPHFQAGSSQEELLQNFRPLARSGLLIDRLFGSRFQGDCLFVDDALPETGDAFSARNHARTSIDRLSRTARDRTLFVSEVIAGKKRGLVGRLRARHPPGVLTCMEGGFPYEYALLLAGLITLDALGGDRSIGLGACHVEIVGEKLRWNDEPAYPLREALKGMDEEAWIDWINAIRGELST